MSNSSSPLKNYLPVIAIVAMGLIGLIGYWGLAGLGGTDRAAEIHNPTASRDTTAGNFHIGEKLPDFTLSDIDGAEIHLSDKLDGEHFVIVTSHHPDCPCAANCGRLVSKMQSEGLEDVTIFGFMSEGTRDKYDLAALKEQQDAGIITYPVYFDHDKKVTNLLGAERTPEIWVLDKDGTIVYWGAPENTLFPGTEGHRYLLEEAVDALRAGETPEVQRYAPIGCPIDVDWDEEVIPPGEQV